MAVGIWVHSDIWRHFYAVNRIQIPQETFDDYFVILLARCDIVQRRITYTALNKIMKTIFSLLVALAVLSPADVAAQSMFKCVQNGKTTFQAEPCAANAKQNILKTGGNAPASSSKREEVNDMIELMSTHRACADGAPGWGLKMIGPYSKWAARNSAAVARIENDPKLHALYQHRVDAKRNASSDMCREVELDLRKKKAGDDRFG